MHGITRLFLLTLTISLAGCGVGGPDDSPKKALFTTPKTENITGNTIYGVWEELQSDRQLTVAFRVRVEPHSVHFGQACFFGEQDYVTVEDETSAKITDREIRMHESVYDASLIGNYNCIIDIPPKTFFYRLEGTTLFLSLSPANQDENSRVLRKIGDL